MKFLTLVSLALFSTCTFAKSLECNYHVLSHYSEDALKYDIDKTGTVVVELNKRVLIQLKGENTKKDFTIRIDSKAMTTGTSLSLSLRQNYEELGGGFSGQGLAYSFGIFSADQKELFLQSSSPETDMDIKCRQN
jgi:hypothetical protein